MDCEVTTCPLYLFLPQAKFEPDLWWAESSHNWRFSLTKALQRKFKKHKLSAVTELVTEDSSDIVTIKQTPPFLVVTKPKPLYAVRGFLRN